MAPLAETAHVPALENLGYVESPSPFTNALLAEHDILLISQAEFRNLLPRIDERTPVLLMDQMNRQVDTTGFVSNFIGRCQTPEEIQAELDTIAFNALSLLKKEPEDVQKMVSMLLIAKDQKDIHVAHKGFLWLDRLHGKVRNELAEKRTKEAEEYRERNLEVIRRHGQSEVMYIPTYSVEPNNPSYFDASRCHLTKITRYMNVPQLPEINRQILLQLTPRVFNRQTKGEDRDPMTLIGFMQQFRKAGDPVSRVLAEKLEEQEKIQQFAEQMIDNHS